MSDSIKKFHRKEIASIFLCCVIIIIGIIEEAVAARDKSLISIEDFRNFSFVLLQIQAGVSTITVALIALISGMINEEVYGISVTRYYMITRPRFFKQIVVVILTISLVFLGTIFNIFELYNMVCVCFFLEWIFIILSIVEIFPVFYGKKKCEKEIKEYVESAMTSSEIREKMEINRVFCESWVSDLEEYDFEQRENLYLLGIENMLLENSDEAISFVNNQAGEIIRNHLLHNEHWINGRGLQLLHSVYERIWGLILDKKVDATKTKLFPNIIQYLFYDVRSVLLHFEIKEIEDYFDYQSLSEYAARVIVYYLQHDKELCQRELSTLEMYGAFLGYLLGVKQNERRMELDDADISYWSRMLECVFISKTNIPEEMIPIFEMHRCKIYFSYIASVIQDGYTELIIKYFYGSNRYVYENNFYEILLSFCVHCYLYYLAVAENDNIVPDKARKSANFIIKQKTNVIYPFEKKLDNFYAFSENYLIEHDFQKLMGKVLKRFEMYNMGQVKQIVMPDVICKWYVTLLLLLDEHCFLNRNITHYLHGDILSYIHMFLIDNYDIVTDEIVSIYETLSFRQVENIEDKKSELYGKLKTALIEKYKEVDIKESYESHKKFISDGGEHILTENAKKIIMERIKRTFASVIDEPLGKSNEISFMLIQLHNETRFLNERTISEFLGLMEGNFCAYLINILYKMGKVKMYDRSDKSDQEYINYLKRKKIDVLMGAEHKLKQKDYTNKRLYEKFERKCNCIYTSGRNALAFVKDKLKIAVRDVNVTIQSGDLSEDNISFDETSGKYRIEFFDKVEGLFDEQEAREYAKNKFKIISVYVKIAIRAEDEAGVIIQN